MGVYQKCLGCSAHKKTWDGYCESCEDRAEMAAKDQRIAELESLIDEANHLIRAYQKGAENVTRTINRLQAERVDTESLEDIIEYGGGCLQKHTIREAQAILDLRRKNKEADHAND